MNNQRGEVVIGVMIVMMAVMMLFGGMRAMRGGHGCGGDQSLNSGKQHQLDEGRQHPHSSAGAEAIVPDREDAK